MSKTRNQIADFISEYEALCEKHGLRLQSDGGMEYIAIVELGFYSDSLVKGADDLQVHIEELRWSLNHKDFVRLEDENK
jgi:hypothetical protein